MPTPEPRLLLTCEHGGHRVPGRWRALFRGQRRQLASAWGWDPGALDVARRLSRRLGAPLLAATTTRLLVDLNRSPHNPAVFSDRTRGLPRAERTALLDLHHRPHWDRVRAALAASGGPVLHVAVHSFAPVWRGVRRPFELGILYDPRRRGERSLAGAWKRSLEASAPALRVRRNAPYRGNADGLTTALRRELGASRYRGIELELNQRLLADASPRRELAALLARTLRDALGAGPPPRRPDTLSPRRRRAR